MRIKNFLLLFSFFSSFLHAQTGGALKALVVSGLTNEPLDSVRVLVYRDSVVSPQGASAYTSIPVLVDSAFTDSSGMIFIRNLRPGIYIIRASKAGMLPVNIRGIVISELKTTYITGTNSVVLYPPPPPKKKKGIRLIPDRN